MSLSLFTADERTALFSAEAKLVAQRRPAGLRYDASVLSEPERVAVAKYLVLGSYGVWRPEFAFMTDAEVAAAVNAAVPMRWDLRQ